MTTLKLLRPEILIPFIYYLRWGLYVTQDGLKLLSFCLRLLNAGILCVHKYAWL
jgi:hypothetical protein